jgi:hypothetical protein
MEVEVPEGLLGLQVQAHQAHQAQFSLQMEVPFVEIQTSSIIQTLLAQYNLF